MLTKSPLVMRDVEIFERMAKKLPVSVNLSVPTLDEEAWRATEPHTPSPSARLDAVAELRRRGIDSGVLIAPLMPGINDSPEQVQPIVDRAREAGATFLGGVALHLRDEVKDVFFAWLEEKRPDLLPRYEELYQRPRLHAALGAQASSPARSAAGAGAVEQRARRRRQPSRWRILKIAALRRRFVRREGCRRLPSRASSELRATRRRIQRATSASPFWRVLPMLFAGVGIATGAFEVLAATIGSGLVVGSFTGGLLTIAASRSRRQVRGMGVHLRLSRRFGGLARLGA